MGDSTGATNPPDRIWQSIETEISIKNRRIISASNKNSTTISGRSLNIQLRPIGVKSSKKNARTSGTNPTLIVLHQTGGINEIPPEFIDKPSIQKSAHYVIPRSGKIIKLVHESDVSYHAGESEWEGQRGVNKFSIGIEIVHKTGAYMDEQYESLIKLLKQLVTTYPSIDAHRIIGHGDVAIGLKDGVIKLGRRENDPGLEFNWSLLENEGLGLIPANESDVFGDSIDLSEFYGGLFQDNPTVSLPIPIGERPENYQDIVREVNEDLKRVGYLVSSDPEAYSEVTKAAVQVFKTHFFTGERRREGKYTVRFDFETAKMLKRVIFSLPS